MKKVMRSTASLILALIILTSTWCTQEPVVVTAQGAPNKQDVMAAAGANGQGTGEYETDRFIVKYKDETGRDELDTAVKGKIKKVKKVKGKNIDRLDTNSKMKASDLMAEIKGKKAHSSIEYIQPDYEMTMASDDTYFSSQWGLGGSSPDGSTGANITSAWEQQAQGSGVTVAVLDTGIDISHEDLSQNIWTNTSEIPNNGIDDDNNGYIDDVNGWNFCDSSNVIHSVDSIGDEQHGTHIAGIIAAVKDNGIGIAGVAPAAKVMPLKVFKDGKAYTSDIIEAIAYAQDKGAKVANCSWGTSYDNPALKEAIEGSSMLFVCAAGNSGANIDAAPVYPASFTSGNIITVASIGKNGELSSFSNYGGASVDVAAPGEDIISILPGNTYGQLGGTSMAAALVSGEAALMLGKEGLTNLQEVRSEILASIYKEASLSGIVGSGGRVSINGEGTTESVGTVPVENIQESSSVQNSVYSEVYQQEFTAFASGTYSATQSETAQVINMPINGLTGELNATIKGSTITNLIGNAGNCEDTTKFDIYHSTVQLDNSNFVFGKNGIKVSVGSGYTCGTAMYNSGLKNIVKPNSYYIASAYLKNGNSSKLTLGIYKGAGLWAISPAITDKSKFNRVLVKFSTSSDVTGNYIEVNVNGTAGQYGYADGIMLNQITADEYNNSTETQLLSKYQYTNGVSSTSYLRLKTIGKNLVPNGNGENGVNGWEAAKLVRDGDYFKGSSLASLGGIVKIVEMPVKPNTKYSISYTGHTDGGIDAVFSIRSKDADVVFDRGIYKTDLTDIKKSFTFDSGSNDTIVLYLWAGSVTGSFWFKELQIEESLSATEYQPYRSSTFYLSNIEKLNSLPNKIKDEIKTDGQYTIRTQEMILNGTEEWQYAVENTNVYVYNLALPGCVKNYDVDNGILQLSEPVPLIREWITTNEKLHFYIENGYIALIMPKSMVAGYSGTTACDKLKNYLSSTNGKVIYQLEQSQTGKISIGPLTGFEGGSIAVNRAIKNTKRYTNSGIGVSNPAFPIKSIESVYRLNNGVMSLVDSVKIHYTPGSTYFTIDGAVSGELYEFTYTYDSSLSTLPAVEFSTPVNTQAQIDGNTDMIKQQSDMISSLMARMEKMEELISGMRTNVGPFEVACTNGTPFNIVVSAANSNYLSNRKFTVHYNKDQIEAIDLCGATSGVDNTLGNIAGTAIAIEKIEPGIIEFIINKPTDGSSLMNSVNTIIFQPKAGYSGSTTISYTAECK